jgi:hypothetical protein
MLGNLGKGVLCIFFTDSFGSLWTKFVYMTIHLLNIPRYYRVLSECRHVRKLHTVFLKACGSIAMLMF